MAAKKLNKPESIVPLSAKDDSLQARSEYALLIALQDIAFFHGAEEDALKFCKQVAIELGDSSLRSMVFCDPILIGVLFTNPWQFFDSEKVWTDEGLAFLLACGWSRKHAPMSMEVSVKRSRKFRSIFRTDTLCAQEPWRIPIARLLVQERYEIHSTTFIDLRNCSLVRSSIIIWFERYIALVKNYKLSTPKRIAFMEVFAKREREGMKEDERRRASRKSRSAGK